ncbi:hypothetical protein [uncultured Eudoraea sp.]|uniref:hypothetical protein n=1 Tax=uncultured Eudoraea sp. TaxID=1035614 RepID=UPI00262119B9|nr:hypothetical protein [uncultured Eudoraea sp.]
MKALKKWFKIIALFFTALILFQSCATYKTPTTLAQAAEQQKEVKIITSTDDAIKYKYIVHEDGQFYGVKVDYDTRENVKFPINTDEVYEVLLKTGGLPTWAWIVIGGVVVIGIVALITVNTMSLSI